MVHLEEKGKKDFKWGHMMADDNDLKVYRSFTSEGVEYSLYDTVYTFHEGAKETDIGKIAMIWETKKRKLVKILWFFRPLDICNFLRGYKPCWNELFLASGEGDGVSNQVPLEAIIGKCSVICTSKDSRNYLPTESEISKADYIFSHVFDVGTRRISVRLPDKIGPVKVERLLNRKTEKVKAAVEDRPVKKMKIEPRTESPDLQQPKQESFEESDEKSQRPANDAQRWLLNLPWEKMLMVAREQRRVLTFIYPDLSYTSSDVEDIILDAFKLKAGAKVTPHRPFSSPLHGHALVIFESYNDANFVLSELNSKCLVDGEGRPFAAIRSNIVDPDRTSSFPGHLHLGKWDKKKGSERVKVVSHSHCTQGNTIEGEMAFQWLVLQKKSDLGWKALHQAQAEEISRCQNQLKRCQPSKETDAHAAAVENVHTPGQPSEATDHHGPAVESRHIPHQTSEATHEHAAAVESLVLCQLSEATDMPAVAVAFESVHISSLAN